MAHSTLQDRLYGRYHLPPSLLYSVIRLSRDGATYDIPVDGDWVTIAVVAERGEIRVSGTRHAGRAGSESGSDAEGEGEGEGDEHGARVSDRLKRQLADDTRAPSADTNALKGLHQPWKPKDPKAKSKGNGKGGDRRQRQPKKYINLRLAALPPRNKLLGGKETGGDALLQLLLFEADSVTRVQDGVGEQGNGNGNGKGKVEKKYRGGSGGAYEKWCNLGVGDVVGIVSPRVLRPLKVSRAWAGTCAAECGGTEGGIWTDRAERLRRASSHDAAPRAQSDIRRLGFPDRPGEGSGTMQCNAKGRQQVFLLGGRVRLCRCPKFCQRQS